MSVNRSVKLRREIYSHDVEQMIEWMADEEVTRYLNEKPDMSDRLEQLLRTNQMDIYTHHFNNRGLFYLVDLKGYDKPIGYLRLIPKKNDKIEMVIAIADKDKWNNGFGTKAVWEGLKEAFLNLRFEVVEAKIHKKNKPSKKVFCKVGFEKKEELNSVQKEIHRLTLDDFLALVA